MRYNEIQLMMYLQPSTQDRNDDVATSEAKNLAFPLERNNRQTGEHLKYGTEQRQNGRLNNTKEGTYICKYGD